MKSLVIRYNDLVLFDGVVEEMAFSDSPAGVNVAAKFAKKQPAGAPARQGANFLTELIAASKNKTEKAVEDYRAAIDETSLTEVAET